MKSTQTERLWQVVAVGAVASLALNGVLLVRREFSGRERPRAAAEAPTHDGPVAGARSQVPRRVDDWSRVRRGGHRMGPADSPVSIVVFSDFQCPFCGRFALEAMPQLERQFAGRLAIIYRHWPLSNHEWAYDAARAAECAARVGKFREFHDALFRGQSEIGSTSFSAFAESAGISDIAAFDRCASSKSTDAAIDADIAEAKRVGGRGTPTIVVNGLLLRPPYSTRALLSYVELALQAPGKGFAPFGDFPKPTQPPKP